MSDRAIELWKKLGTESGEFLYGLVLWEEDAKALYTAAYLDGMRAAAEICDQCHWDDRHELGKGKSARAARELIEAEITKLEKADGK